MEYVERNCKHCDEIFDIQIISKGKRKGELKRDQLFCGITCLNKWQKETTWEDRIGKSRADEIRLERSEQVSGDKNPSCNPEVAKKISESLSKTLKSNPELRQKENNPFYGKTHTDEYKEWASSSRAGKRSYDEAQFKKQNANTPKLDKHPNWNGGISYEDYDYAFTALLKKEIKERDNYTCQICDNQPNKLHIHHIDYNKQNSVKENLISLCNSCHSKTNWRRKSWIEFFKPIMLDKI